ncbi:hypothetical protein AVEN_101335-1 [Araneus ventricosus]|uniref:Uncharacterized protein n=1 Tax=Araneus ventricosus TaxID=182803 RepID=A0A4Y2T7S1_ARAVE|nr:hypothetical protein AVEN_101335-1 [Araneus ventricosus]
MGPAESDKYHKGVLEMNADLHPTDLANSRINPTQRTIKYLYEKWRLLNIGPRNGHGMIEALYTTVVDSFRAKFIANDPVFLPNTVSFPQFPSCHSGRAINLSPDKLGAPMITLGTANDTFVLRNLKLSDGITLHCPLNSDN